MIVNDELKKAAWKGMVWRFLERCSSQIVGFIISVVLARLLLPEQYGLVAMTMIFITISEVFVTSGLGSSLVQQAKYDEQAFSTMFWASVALSVGLYILLFFGAPYIAFFMHTPELSLVLRVLGLRLPISAMNSIQQAYVAQQMIFKKFFFSTLSGTFLSGVVGIAMAYAGLGVWALVGQNFTMIMGNTLALRAIIPWRPTFYFNKTIFQRLYGYSWRLMASSVIGTFFDQLRGFLIGRYYAPADLAYANRGALFPRVLSGNISTALQTVLFPFLSRIKEDKDAVREAERKSMMIGSFLVAGLMAAMAGTAGSLVDILLTHKWMATVPYLQCCCLLECFGFLGSTNMQTIKALGRADIVLNLEFVKKPIYFLLIVIGVTISPLAVVGGNMIYNLIGAIINAWPNRKLLNYGLAMQLKDAGTPVILGGVVFAMLQQLDTLLPHTIFWFIAQGMTGLLVYFFLGKVFRLPGAEYSYQWIIKKLRK